MDNNNWREIHRVLHEAGVIHNAQDGYRLDQETMMSLPKVINQIEGAIRSYTSRCGTSVEPTTPSPKTFISWYGCA
jgi:hypothetical protein